MLARDIGMFVDERDFRRADRCSERGLKDDFRLAQKLLNVQPGCVTAAVGKVEARLVKEHMHGFSASLEAVNMDATELDEPLDDELFAAFRQAHPEGFPVFVGSIELAAVEQVCAQHQPQPQVRETLGVTAAGGNPVRPVKASLVIPPQRHKPGGRQGAPHPVQDEAGCIGNNLPQVGDGFGACQALGFQARSKMRRRVVVKNDACRAV